MGLHISFKHPFGKHSVFHQAGGVVKKLAPLAALIPGVGPVAAGIAGGLGGLAHGEGLGGALAGAAGGALPAYLLGGQGVGGLSGILGKSGTLAKLGGFAASHGLGNAAGGLDFGKLAGVGMAGANLIGANQQRKSAQKYTNANTDLRNQLMSRILSSNSGRTYNFQPESP